MGVHNLRRDSATQINIMKTKSIVVLTAAGLLILANGLSAQVPSVISYQGRVQAGGTTFPGRGRFKLALVSRGPSVSGQATATATVTAGFVTGIMVTDGGGGYV